MANYNHSLVKKKIIRDPVHGYISIDEKIFRDIIDTPQFQRLRRIQQTNLDVLFPAATHTRFEHSIGVYYLGSKLFDSIVEKCPPDIKEEVENYRKTVLLACLLHDIGHAPMSHIGESFFDGEEIKQELRKNGIKIETTTPLHEMMSVLIGITVFKDVLKEYKCDTDLFFRLITGRTLAMEGCSSSKNTPVKEALRAILNSPFDVDKMDFVFRDASSAGVPSLELDLERIINSACLVYDKDDGNKLRLAFGKSGFSVVSTLVDNRNYMFSWIYGHHKVQFHNYVLTRYITKLKEIYPEFRKFFSYQAVIGDCDIGLPILKKVSYVDDHDLFCILKNIALINPELKIFSDSLFKRDPYKPLWKTKIEFDEIKGRFSSKLQYIIPRIDSPEFANEFATGIEGIDNNDIILFKWSSKVVFPSPITNPVYFFLDLLGEKRIVKTYSDLFVPGSSGIPRSQTSTDEIEKQMFYVFIKKEKFTPKIQTSIIDKFSSL